VCSSYAYLFGFLWNVHRGLWIGGNLFNGAGGMQGLLGDLGNVARTMFILNLFYIYSLSFGLAWYSLGGKNLSNLDRY
jgi:hypothetical protein